MICQSCGTENGATRPFSVDSAGRLEAGRLVCGTPDAVQGEGAGITAQVRILFESAGRQALEVKATRGAGWRPRWQLP